MTNLIKKNLLFIGLFIFLACNSDPSTDQPEETVTSTPEKVEEVVSAPIAEKKEEEKSESDEKPEEKEEPSAKKEEVKEEKKEEVKEEKPKPKRKKKRPTISFNSTTHDYGVIMQGDKINHQFKFTNKGKADLVISGVTASCGCTQPSYPFIPIKPGEEGSIGVVFDSKGKLGRQVPTITVVTNARPTTYKLKLNGFVDAERAEEQPDTPESPEGEEGTTEEGQ